MIIGTAGHIDHGKTTLVKALTGIDGDRLKEEKARGITIELGFAYVPTGTGDTLGFVDVPGHERFVHTMLAGAAGIDFALLVIAADDGPKPQTLEHLAIIDLLGIRRGLVVLTKSDLVDGERLLDVKRQARSAIAGTVLGDADIIAVSTRSGAGIAELRRHLVEAAAETADRSAGRLFRLAVDRSFTLAGIGAVVTGTVLSGQAKLGDRVTIGPVGLPARIRSMHVQNQPAEETRAGDRCALNLAGIGISKESVKRGDIVLDSALHAPTDRVDAMLRLLPTEPKPVGQWFPVRFHHASAEVGARIVPLDEEPIAPGGSGFAQLVLDAPIAAAVGDRFVIRDTSAQRTIGGGVLVDLRPPTRKRRTPERGQQRDAMALADPATALAALLEAPPYAWNIDIFARDRALHSELITDIARQCNYLLFGTDEGHIALSPARWRAFSEALTLALTGYHEQHPDVQGLGREKLRLSLIPRLPPQAFAAALQKLAGEGLITIEGAFVRLPTHQVMLTPADEALWATIAPMLDGEERFRPPRVRDIAATLDKPEADIRRLMKLCGRLGRVDEVAHDHFFLRETARAMVALIVDIDHVKAGEAFTAAEFRDRVQNGRKVAIQILDFFDRLGVTLRRGDLRRPNRHRLDQFGPLHDEMV